MRVLLVDDEKPALEGLEFVVGEQVDLVQEVYTASDVDSAKKILEEEVVDVVVTDIEMPMGSGLQLLKWIREQQIEIECIFQTCHEKFAFVKEALSLGSSDYLVKPVQAEEIREALTKAGSHIEARLEVKNKVNYANSMERYHNLIPDIFLQELLYGRVDMEDAATLEQCRQHGLPVLENRKIFLVYIAVQRKGKSVADWEPDLYDFVLRNIIEEKFDITGKKQLCQANFMTNFHYAVLLQESDLGWEETVGRCRQLIRWMHNEYDTDIQIFVDEAFGIKGISVCFDRLLKRQGESLWLDDFFLWEGRKAAGLRGKELNYSLLADLTEKERYEEVFGQIRSFVNETCQDSCMTVTVLYSLCRDIYGMVRSRERKRVESVEGGFQNFYEKAKESEEKALEQFRYLLGVSGDKTAVEQVIQFIDSNINQEITRKMLEDEVHLNRDYLNRLFKKETGVSLAEYISKKKAEVAKELLIMTDLPVGEVGGWIGYDNFSYFSRFFRKMTGESPMEFRQGHKGE